MTPLPSTPESKGLAAPSGSAGSCVLLVDDDPAVRELARRILTPIGHEVLEAEHGDQALDILDREGSAVDLIILDLTMPVRDGHQTLDALRERGHTGPIIVASGYSPRSVSRPDEIAGFIQKPFRVDTFRDLVERVLAGHGRSSAD